MFKINTLSSEEIEHNLPQNTPGRLFLSSKNELILRYNARSGVNRFSWRYLYQVYDEDKKTWKKTTGSHVIPNPKILYKNNKVVTLAKTIDKSLLSAFPQSFTNVYKKLRVREGMVYDYLTENAKVFQSQDVLKTCSIGDNLAAFVSKKEVIFVDL